MIRYKNISIYLLSIGLFSIFLSCEKTIDSDEYFNVSSEKLPSFMVSDDSLSFDRIKLSVDLTLNGDENILESGFFVSEDASFPTAKTKMIVSEPNDLHFEKWVDKLIGTTEYFYKAYTVSENGFSFSEVKSFVTEEPPIFEDTYLFGSYNQIDYSIKFGIIDGEQNGYWDEHGYMTIKQIENTYNQIEVFNFWGYGRTIIGEIDFETKEIKFSPMEIAYSDSHGSIVMRKWEMEDNSILVHVEDAVMAEYDEKGNITIKMWGGFAYFNEAYYIYEACSETRLIKKDL